MALDSDSGFGRLVGLDYFGARYFSGAQGRFTSPDPNTGTVLHILNPQRWNMYAYAVNNPLLYVDPDGRDAIAVKFGNGAPVGPIRLGHAGFGVVHRDGKVRYADFAPQHAGSFRDKGQYAFDEPTTTIQFGSDGLPTKQSLVALANELAGFEGASPESVSIAYFKTSDAETAAADAYYDNAVALQKQGKQPDYWGATQNCMNFCVLGLRSAGKTDFNNGSAFDAPNWTWWRIAMWADATATGEKKKPDPEVDRKPPHKRCLQNREGGCVQ